MISGSPIGIEVGSAEAMVVVVVKQKRLTTEVLGGYTQGRPKSSKRPGKVARSKGSLTQSPN